MLNNLSGSHLSQTFESQIILCSVMETSDCGLRASTLYIGAVPFFLFLLHRSHLYSNCFTVCIIMGVCQYDRFQVPILFVLFSVLEDFLF